jgi:hypothetical protein
MMPISNEVIDGYRDVAARVESYVRGADREPLVAASLFSPIEEQTWHVLQSQQ